MASLKLLASGPGTGKTTHCIELFRSKIMESQGGIESRSFFVLPNREHAERIQNLILRGDVPGLFNAHILTIHDLAEKLADEPPLPAPSEALRLGIIREILEGSAKFKYFDKSTALPGFHALCADLIKEFKSAVLSVKEFEKRAQPLLKDSVFRLKFKDFSILIKNYEEQLAIRGFAESEESLAQISKRIRTSSSVELVVFDGFYHFSKAQQELLRALSKVSREIVATLTLSEKTNGRSDLFYYSEKTRKFLTSIGFKQEKAPFLTNHRAKNPELDYLSKQLFSKTTAAYLEPVKGISVFEAPSTQGEMEMVAREIRRLLREEKLYLSDICVILRNVSPYQKMIASIFERFDLPVHIHERYKLKETAIGSALYRFLNLFLLGWKKEDLFFVLKSGICQPHLSIEEVLGLERAAFTANILEGRSRWQMLSEKPEISQAVRDILERLLFLEAELSMSDKGHKFLAPIRSFLKLAKVENEETNKTIEDMLKNMQRLANRQKGVFDPVQSAKQLQILVEAALFSVKPAGKNRVQVYDVVMALPKEYKVVFISGLLERVFPQAVMEEPVFKDEERRVMNRQGEILEERRFRVCGERYFFYMAVTRAKEKIYLTYPLFDGDGRPSLPSFFVEEVRKCFKGEIFSKTRFLSDFLPQPDEWENEKEVTRGLAGLLGDERIGEASKKKIQESMAGWLAQPDFEEILDWMRRPELHAVLSDVKILAEFSERRGPFSATRLEVMAACAFRHFAGEVLGLEEPLEGRDAIEMGVALHKTLETYFKSLEPRIRESGGFIEDLSHAKQVLWDILLPIAEASPLAKGKKYRFKLQLEIMKRAVDIFVESEADLFKKRGLMPSEFELRFGYGQKGEPGLLEVGEKGQLVSIRGQIDRVDIAPDGKTALVTDYKLSKRPSVHGKIESGLELQLPIYLLAARHLLKMNVMGAEHRYLKDGGRQGIYREDAKKALGLSARERAYSDEEFESLLQETEQRIKNLVQRIQKGDIAVRSKSCTFCHFSPVCRFEPWKLVYTEKAGES